jgi:amino acid transporter
VCLGVIILRKKDPSRIRPFRVPLGYILPVLGVIGCIFLIGYLPPTSWLRFAAWLNVGIIVYVCYGSVTSKLTGRAQSDNPVLHNVRTAWNGVMLGITGVAFMMVAHLADAYKDGQLAPNWWTDHTGWLTIPLILNAIFLYPAIILRATKAKNSSDIPDVEKSRAQQAVVTAALMMILTVAYLWAAHSV